MGVVRVNATHAETTALFEGVDKQYRARGFTQAIYELLEKQIVPLFYQLSNNGLPHGWIRVMKESIKTNAPRFSARRMVKEYIDKFYLKALQNT